MLITGRLDEEGQDVWDKMETKIIIFNGPNPLAAEGGRSSEVVFQVLQCDFMYSCYALDINLQCINSLLLW